MSEKEKSILESITKSVAKMTAREQERLAYVAEGIAIASENTAKENPAE